MRKINFKKSLWLGAVAMLVSGVAFAEGSNVANGKKIFTEGKGDAQACLTCHGDNAQGNDAMGAPRLANIGYGYVVKQLTNFAEDKRVPTGVGAVMPGFAKALNAQDRRDVAAYLNSITTAPELSNLKELKDSGTAIGESYKGAQIVKMGQGKISACTSCHDYNGRGVDPIFPKIGQQKYVYLVHQLHNWRAAANKATDDALGTGPRANDPSGMMQAVAKTMTDDDINNLAAYLSAASPTRGVGDGVPNNDTLLNKANEK